MALAALLALVVGAVRLLIGLGRGGGVTKLMTRPILRGFTAAAALLIVMSQLPSAVGASPTNEGVVARAVWTLGHIGKWEGASIVIAVATIGLIFGGRRIHALFPGVLVAGALALMWSVLNDYSGSVIGDVPTGFPGLELDLPWERVPGLLIPGVIIALVGFAEPAAIAQTFAEEEGVPWDADREFVSQGVANLAAGLSGAFPVGGSFSRSALNRLAGAKSRLAGGVTGVVVLLFLPIAGVLSPLPRAVLGATVIAAVATLLKPRPMLELGSLKTAPAVIGWGTFVATLALAPRVELGVLVGIGLHGLFVGVRRLRRDP